MVKKRYKKKSDFRDRRHEFIAEPDVHKLIVLAVANSEHHNKSLILNECARRQLGLDKETKLRELKKNIEERKKLNRIFSEHDWEIPDSFYDE